VIVIDNASPNQDVNNTILDFYRSTQIDFSYYRNSKNLGWANSFNLSVKLIEASYFMFLFDDDELLPTFSDIIDSIDLTSKQGIYFDHYVKYVSGSLNLKRGLRLIFEKLVSPFAKYSLQLNENSILFTVPSFIGAIYNKSSFLELGGIESKYGPTADYAFTISYWKNYGIIRYKSKFIRYYHGDNSSSKQEVFSLFADCNYQYRDEFLNSFSFRESKKKYYSYVIEAIYHYEKCNRSLINSAIYMFLFIMRKLNLI
jgi:GT2 family glycosyltransferase